MRVLRFILGISIIVQGAVSGTWSFIILGMLFTLLPVLNIGCCGASGCRTPVSKNSEGVEDISYEEIK